MTTDYDPIADKYRLAKAQPWRAHVEAFTLLELIGDVTGLTVLDLACGEGFYTRMLRRCGARAVTGIDLSAGMIDLARKQEADHRLGITYRVGDARTLDLPPTHDLAVAAYLLNYARDRAELGAMCRGIGRSLRPGGRFVAANTNPAMHFPTAPDYRAYGFEATADEPFPEGTPITWTFHVPGGPIQVENYHLGVEAHEEAFRAAGFRDVRWHAPRVSGEGRAAFPADHWKLLLDQPPITFIECVK